MSKRIVMSVLATIAMSIGGFFVSCGSGSDDSAGPADVVVQLPAGCSLVSPRDPVGVLGGAVTMAPVKPGKKNEFILSCDGRMVQVDKDIAPDQRAVSFTEDELK
ncbi:MAG TPA: hypothetical protein VHE55_06785 [Fimbriimonadaceae bacterium]|nr:hypothetical protein [Fimbriimonadaceae bacterium]